MKQAEEQKKVDQEELSRRMKEAEEKKKAEEAEAEEGEEGAKHHPRVNPKAFR